MHDSGDGNEGVFEDVEDEEAFSEEFSEREDETREI